MEIISKSYLLLFNTKSDYCMVCGYDGEIQIVDDKKTGRLEWECPNCHNRDQNKMSVARRTCGKRPILPQ